MTETEVCDAKCYVTDGRTLLTDVMDGQTSVSKYVQRDVSVEILF